MGSPIIVAQVEMEYNYANNDKILLEISLEQFIVHTNKKIMMMFMIEALQTLPKPFD